MKFFNFKKFRNERGLRQVDVAKTLGISQGVVSYLENANQAITDYQITLIKERYKIKDIAPYIYERDTYPTSAEPLLSKHKPGKDFEGDWNKPRDMAKLADIAVFCQIGNVYISVQGDIIFNPNNGVGFLEPPYVIHHTILGKQDLVARLTTKPWFNDLMFEEYKRAYIIACALAKVAPAIQQKPDTL